MKTLTRFEAMTRELMRDIDDYLAELDSQDATSGSPESPAGERS